MRRERKPHLSLEAAGCGAAPDGPGPTGPGAVDPLTSDPIWAEPFHAAAFAAFVQEARLAGGWPDCEAVKRRAYRLYEQGLAEKNARRRPSQPSS